MKLTIHVQPGASRSQITGFADGVLKVKIAAPPVRGKANQELIKLLRDVLGVSKSKLSINKGLTGKNKIVAVEGISFEEVKNRLEKGS